MNNSIPCSPTTDPKECSAIKGICGKGTCVEETDTNGFYSCQCDEGYEMAGDPATLSRTCIGIITNFVVENLKFWHSIKGG